MKNVGILLHPTFNSILLSGSLDSRLTFSRASNATMFDSTGTMVYAPSNMLLNSAMLADQSVTVLAGASYTLSFYGTGSVAVSGGVTDNLAGTGAAVRVYKNLAASSTTSITFTVTGSVTQAQLERTSYNSPQTYNATAAAAYYGPRFDHNPNTVSLLGLLLEGQKSNRETVSSFASEWIGAGSTLSMVSSEYVPGFSQSAKLTENTSTSAHLVYRGSYLSYSAGSTYTISVFLKAGTEYVAQLVAAGGGTTAYANFNLSNGTIGAYSATSVNMQKISNGWYRCSLTYTAGSSSTSQPGNIYFTNNDVNAARLSSYTGSGKYLYMYGFQNEIGNFATSYIPTFGASVTRYADFLYTTSIPWFNATSGSFVVTGIAGGYSATVNSRYATFSDGTSNNAIATLAVTNTESQALIVNGGSSYTSAGGLTPSVNFKSGVVYASGANLSAYNGTLHTNGTFGAAPVPTGINRLDIGNRHAGDMPFFGWVQHFTYWNHTLTNSQLQTVTT